jgi:hypothetical protein
LIEVMMIMNLTIKKTWIILAMATGVMSGQRAEAAPTPKVGDKAPLVEASDQDGNAWKLAEVIGKKAVLLYFTPKTTPRAAPRRPAVCGIAWLS